MKQWNSVPTNSHDNLKRKFCFKIPIRDSSLKWSWSIESSCISVIQILDNYSTDFEMTVCNYTVKRSYSMGLTWFFIYKIILNLLTNFKMSIKNSILKWSNSIYIRCISIFQKNILFIYLFIIHFHFIQPVF